MLQQFTERAERAFYWTSFSPERRGKNTISEAEAELQSDIEELTKGGAGQEEIDSYTERFKHYFGAWLGAKSRCISSMITGPARFPTRRAEKANRSEHNHYEVFQAWRRKATKAIIRKAQPAKTYNSELEGLQKKLAGLKRFQESVKKINKLIKSKKIIETEKVIQLMGVGYSEAEANSLLAPDFMGRVGIPSYRLTNNNANMKRIEGRIKELEAKEALRQEAPSGEKEIAFEGGVVVLNYELDRVQIKFPGKPEAAKIQELKKNGFRWAPSQTAWQRQLTGNGLYAARFVTGVNFQQQ